MVYYTALIVSWITDAVQDAVQNRTDTVANTRIMVPDRTRTTTETHALSQKPTEIIPDTTDRVPDTIDLVWDTTDLVWDTTYLVWDPS